MLESARNEWIYRLLFGFSLSFIHSMDYHLFWKHLQTLVTNLFADSLKQELVLITDTPVRRRSVFTEETQKSWNTIIARSSLYIDEWSVWWTHAVNRKEVFSDDGKRQRPVIHVRICQIAHRKYIHVTVWVLSVLRASGELLKSNNPSNFSKPH